MDEKMIQGRIEGYKKTREEWIRRRQAALVQADECLAHANACNGAIEALEGVLPAAPIEDVLRSVGGEVK